MTEISASGDNPEHLAMETAANAAITAGYDGFSILRTNPHDNSFDMLIRMSNADDPITLRRFVARDVLQPYN